MSSQSATTPRTAPFKELIPEADSVSSEQPLSATNKAHPEFADDDADIILCSSDGVHFRVHSIILKLSSGWFRALFTLPQGHASELSSSSSSSITASDGKGKPVPAPQQDPIVVNENAELLEMLLRMACGKELPVHRLQSLEFIQDLLQVAEKYDMPGPASIARLAVSLTLVKKHPIRVYGIACRWGWTDIAKTASSYTLHLDLLGAPCVEELRHVGSADLTRLMMLHRKRRDQLRRSLDSKDLFYANLVPGKCSGCNADILHNKWHSMKYAWVTELEEKPFVVAEKDLLERPEVLEVLDSKCPRCQKSLYNAETTLHNLRSILDELPTMVEVCGLFWGILWLTQIGDVAV